MTPKPKGIDALLRWLRRYLFDAEWENDQERVEHLRAQIARLEMLKSLGETHDVDH